MKKEKCCLIEIKRKEIKITNKVQDSICPIIKELERISDALTKHFNVKASRPLITIQTKGRSKHLLGWYGKKRWKIGKKELPEINICAESLNKNPVETLVHEMVHYHNSCEDIEDCNSQQYHNKHFRTRAETYGLNVEKDGRRGWSITSISPKLQSILDTIKINKKVFSLYRQVKKSTPAITKAKKFSCGCTNVRCAVDLEAKCLKCDNVFEEE